MSCLCRYLSDLGIHLSAGGEHLLPLQGCDSFPQFTERPKQWLVQEDEDRPHAFWIERHGGIVHQLASAGGDIQGATSKDKVRGKARQRTE